jgi:hypothetical protein
MLARSAFTVLVGVLVAGCAQTGARPTDCRFSGGWDPACSKAWDPWRPALTRPVHCPGRLQRGSVVRPEHRRGQGDSASWGSAAHSPEWLTKIPCASASLT